MLTACMFRLRTAGHTNQNYRIIRPCCCSALAVPYASVALQLVPNCPCLCAPPSTMASFLMRMRPSMLAARTTSVVHVQALAPFATGTCKCVRPPCRPRALPPQRPSYLPTPLPTAGRDDQYWSCPRHGLLEKKTTLKTNKLTWALYPIILAKAHKAEREIGSSARGKRGRQRAGVKSNTREKRQPRTRAGADAERKGNREASLCQHRHGHLSISRCR